MLTGGLGADAFVFRERLVAGNIDTITDFNVADDRIGWDTRGCRHRSREYA